jgi:hypothetical protein
MGFYKWRERDFITIRAYELVIGDEIALGNSPTLKYGAIPLETVTVIRGVPVLVQYTLPVGAIAISSPDTRIMVTWEGNRPCIHVSQDIDYYAPVLIRRK